MSEELESRPRSVGDAHRELAVQQRITGEGHGDDHGSGGNCRHQHRRDAGLCQGAQAYRDSRQACEWPPQESANNTHSHRSLRKDSVLLVDDSFAVLAADGWYLVPAGQAQRRAGGEGHHRECAGQKRGGCREHAAAQQQHGPQCECEASAAHARNCATEKQLRQGAGYAQHCPQRVELKALSRRRVEQQAVRQQHRRMQQDMGVRAQRKLRAAGGRGTVRAQLYGVCSLQVSTVSVSSPHLFSHVCRP